jgi:hypothetical protein
MNGLAHAACRAVLVVAAMAAAASARAGDGRIEINQTCAVRTGCTSSDPPGFPVELLSSGSYLLTSNLEVSDPNRSAILVNSDHVWIDLAGFTLQGPNACENPGPQCVLQGFGAGVVIITGSYTTVRNGTARGFGGGGILLYDHARVENVLVSENGGAGVTTNDGSLVRGVRAVRNLGVGISGFLLTDADGKANVLVDNLIDRNQAHGLRTGEGAVVAGNLSDGNGGSGIEALVGAHAIHDNRVRRNSGNGIRASAGALVDGNTVTENAGLGLFLNPAAGYVFNVIRSDPAIGGSTTVNGGQNLSGNLCNGSTTCP